MLSGPKPKNVIVLIVDSLRYDRLGHGGQTPSPSPVMDRLMQSGLCLDNFFAVGAPTDFAYLGMVGSSLPLSRGGHDHGMSTREVALAEVFRDAGYRTGVFLHDNFDSAFQYHRGFTDIFTLYDPNRLHARLRVDFKYYSRRLRSGASDLAHCTAELQPRLQAFFDDALAYCTAMRQLQDSGYLDDSLLLRNHNYEELGRIMARGREILGRTPVDLVRRWLGEEGDTPFDELLSFIRLHQSRPNPWQVDAKLRGLLWSGVVRQLLAECWGRHNHKALKSQIKRVRDGQHKSVNYSSAAYLYRKFIQWSDGLGEQPFFAWLHTGDVHDLSFASYDVMDGGDLIDGEVAMARNLRREISSAGRQYHGNPLYDYSVRYADAQIGLVLKALSERGKLDETLVVITADHGHNSPCWPVRKSIHLTTHFYDELYHVPAAFVHQGIKPSRLDGLFSALDLGPTILTMAGLPVPKSFEGLVVDGQTRTGRKYVQMESTGAGPCDFTANSINICIRTKSWKIVFQSPPPQKNQTDRIKELYDLGADPLEMDNLAGSPLPAGVKPLVEIAQARVVQIRRESAQVRSGSLSDPRIEGTPRSPQT